MIYDIAIRYDNWLENLQKIAENKDRNLLDTILSRTDLKKMKSIHTEIQKAIDWSQFDRTQLLFCLKQMIEKLGINFEDQFKKKRKQYKEEGKANKLMQSFKTGKLPKGAIQLDSMPKIIGEVQNMINTIKDKCVNLPSGSLVLRSAVKLENGEYYEGQWTKEGIRQGVGR